MQYLGHTQHLSKTRAALRYHLNVLFQYSKAEKSEDASVILEALWQGYSLSFYPCPDDAHSLCIYVFMEDGFVIPLLMWFTVVEMASQKLKILCFISTSTWILWCSVEDLRASSSSSIEASNIFNPNIKIFSTSPCCFSSSKVILKCDSSPFGILRERALLGWDKAVRESFIFHYRPRRYWAYRRYQWLQLVKPSSLTTLSCVLCFSHFGP